MARSLMTRGERDARDLRQRVHARVGPPGTVNGNGPAFERRQRILQQPLNRYPLGLTLPADEVRAVVTQSSVLVLALMTPSSSQTVNLRTWNLENLEPLEP